MSINTNIIKEICSSKINLKISYMICTVLHKVVHVEYFYKRLLFYSVLLTSVFTARRSYASAVLGVVIMSVCPSVRLSVCHTHAL